MTGRWLTKRVSYWLLHTIYSTENLHTHRRNQAMADRSCQSWVTPTLPCSAPLLAHAEGLRRTTLDWTGLCSAPPHRTGFRPDSSTAYGVHASAALADIHWQPSQQFGGFPRCLRASLHSICVFARCTNEDERRWKKKKDGRGMWKK
jgi:hypothetical protein